jgi:hypothetical protein
LKWWCVKEHKYPMVVLCWPFRRVRYSAT